MKTKIIGVVKEVDDLEYYRTLPPCKAVSDSDFSDENTNITVETYPVKELWFMSRGKVVDRFKFAPSDEYSNAIVGYLNDLEQEKNFANFENKDLRLKIDILSQPKTRWQRLKYLFTNKI